MPLLVRNIKLALGESEDLLPQRVAARLRLPPDAIRSYAVVRRSLDARRHERPAMVYNVELALHGGGGVER
ncbi:MAG: hypothetical protein V3T70_11005, partial [Phycisphaerae bacterium]